MKILTNHPGQQSSETWRRITTRVWPEGGILGDVKCALRLIRKSSEFDCVVLGNGKSDIIYSVLTAILPWRFPPLYRIDCLWYYPRNKVHGCIKRIEFYFERRSVRRYFVWASREVKAYSEAYPIPSYKIEFIPFHHTINDEKPNVRDEGYIFSGGNFDRDYRTLVKAVEGLDIEVRIATFRTEWLEGVDLPGNVQIRQYSHRDYLDAMAACRISVVSMVAGTLHSGGQQTFLNSMALGKPTIVTDREGGGDYIQDGHNGILVDPGDSEALRKAILRILRDPDLGRILGGNAAEAWAKYSTERHFSIMTKRIANDLGGQDRETAWRGRWKQGSR